MCYVGMSLSFSKLYLAAPQRCVNLADLGIRFFCQMANAWWPLEFIVMGLRWSDVYMLYIYFSATDGETFHKGIHISPAAGAALCEFTEK